ncbi:MAG: Wadjet anti-phage system protein JetD domain-containing protein, partial [Burkholderiales bacterium]
KRGGDSRRAGPPQARLRPLGGQRSTRSGKRGGYMTWTGQAELRVQLRRLWDRGVLLHSLLDEEQLFPLRLALVGPTSTELADRFEAVRGWIAELTALRQVRIEWRAVKHRVLGSQRVPQSVWVDDMDSALTLIGKRAEAARFRQLIDSTRSHQPALLDWLAKRPLAALELEGEWERLLAVVGWLHQRPRPGIYLRQIDLPGVHSKFIESHRGVLAEWLDRALPADAIDAAQAGAARFNARYGLLDKSERIRFRVLDPALNLLPGAPAGSLPDITLDADSFAALDLPLARVFITENETNFLAFPLVARSIVLFGAGYGWNAHARARWLDRCTIHYWGDIDTHGFAILDQLRSRFAHVRSLLMDRSTLMAHEALWGEEKNQVLHDLPRLDAAERALFDDLRDNRIALALRLEQERIGFGWVKQAVHKIAS